MGLGEREEKLGVLERGLERAADVVGDITGPVMARFYASHPEALEAFERHGLGDRDLLEARMVENCLYFMMNWYDRPREVLGLIEDSVPHHTHTLEVGGDWYGGMLAAALGVVMDTIPSDEAEEQQVWTEMRSRLLGEIANAASW